LNAVQKFGDSNWSVISKTIKNKLSLDNEQSSLFTAKNCAAKFSELLSQLRKRSTTANKDTFPIDRLCDRLRSERIQELKQSIQSKQDKITEIYSDINKLESNSPKENSSDNNETNSSEIHNNEIQNNNIIVNTNSINTRNDESVSTTGSPGLVQHSPITSRKRKASDITSPTPLAVSDTESEESSTSEATTPISWNLPKQKTSITMDIDEDPLQPQQTLHEKIQASKDKKDNPLILQKDIQSIPAPISTLLSSKSISKSK